MKKNVIWVDFTAKCKSKEKPKSFLENLISRIKNFFTPSSKRNHNSKTSDKYHKSIL
jgi:hypothetical protein